MSYFSDDTFKNKLQFGEFTISGNPVLNGHFTLSNIGLNNFDSGVTVAGGGTLTITFPPGKYMFRAVLDVTRANSNDGYKFQFLINNVLTGAFGQTNLFGQVKSELAEKSFASTSNIDLSIRCIGVQGSRPTLTTDSKLYVWRIQ